MCYHCRHKLQRYCDSGGDDTDRLYQVSAPSSTFLSFHTNNLIAVTGHGSMFAGSMHWKRRLYPHRTNAFFRAQRTRTNTAFRGEGMTAGLLYGSDLGETSHGHTRRV